MDQAAAQKLVRETLQGSFNKERFVSLIKNLLNHMEEASFTYKGQYIFADFHDSIRLIERIGKYTDSDEKLFDILVVHLQKETSLERARTKQRNFVAKYLKGSRGGVLKDAALVAFVAPDGEDWRFSFIKMEYKFNEKGKVKEEFTPARRYSFLVGKNETSHTAQSRLLPLLLDDERQPTLEDLEDAFSVEKATQEFFEKYRDLFLRLQEALDRIVEKEQKIRVEFKSKQVSVVDFAKKLLGQIVFLYFLQKKGWFGVKRGSLWGSGSKHFLRELFNEKHGDYKNFFNDILEPLFYEALRLERPGDYYSRFDCRIPFLNGGLFDPINDYDWIETEILLPDELFSNDRKTKEGDAGDGILDVFDRYNFTVKEDEPLEKEVAVDPEMLGKVFENLLEIKNRKSKGTYYTPREIVHYMCQESLVEYLYGEFNPEIVAYETLGDDQMAMFGNEAKKKQLDLTIQHRQRSLIDKKDIETLIRYGESVVEHERRVVSEGREIGRYSFKLPERIRANALRIDEKLAGVRVCDPAVGSGAFLVGMMNEIIRARGALTPHVNENQERTPYDFKRHAIQNCLYGVDLDSGAIEIAKLRLWLSLVVDEEERESIQPLPNLDYKIVCGNSLLGVNKLFNHKSLKKLEELKPLQFNETSAVKKQNRKKQIDDLISQITDGHKDFDFEVYFSEVFREQKGFDVVIGNPPYMGFQGFKDKSYLKSHYVSAVGKFDIYLPFIEKGLKVLREDGLLEYICPTNFTKRRYGQKLREYLKTNVTILTIADFQDVQIFKGALNYTGIYLFKKSKPFPKNKIRYLTRSLADKGFYLHQHTLVNENWIFRDSRTESLIQKISNQPVTPLGEISVRISEGIVTGKNDVFLLDKDEVKAIGIEQGVVKPCVRGKQLRKHFIEDTTEYVIYPYELLAGKTKALSASKMRMDYPKAWRYLQSQREKLAGRSYFEQSAKEWFELWNQRNMAELCKKKILVPELAEANRFALADEHLFYGDTVCGITVKETTKESILYILGVLNSRLIEYFFKQTTVPKANQFYIYKTMFLKKIPIRTIRFSDSTDKSKHDLIVTIVDYIINAKRANPKADTTKQEAKINQLVYGLYDLTAEEIKIVEHHAR